jgi:polysaccharide deacetylase 2 family uncharacterized protein YibQ
VNARPDKLEGPSGVVPRNGRTVRRAGAALLAAAVLFAGGAAIIALTRLSSSPEPFAVAPIRIHESAVNLPPESRPRTAPTAPRPHPAAEGPIRLAPAPDQRLVEPGPYGMLPRIGPDGARPSRVYARPVPPHLEPGPRIAIVVGSLGIGQTATAEAIARLPPAVTLAFAPYGDDVERAVAKARSEGHEVMLQVPMEPFDYPDSDPGPHTLTTRARKEENLDRLHWVMGRFPGYVGMVNLMGAKLTADAAALEPILREIASRGLFFLDDGASSRSVVASGTFETVPTGRAHLVLDGVARPEAIDAELKRLEETARRNGLAIATASARPVTIERIALWAKELESSGIRLVPVSFAIEGYASR